MLNIIQDLHKTQFGELTPQRMKLLQGPSEVNFIKFLILYFSSV